MITLITGAPGIGKTACTVSMIMDGLFGDRPLFVDGIPELKLTHFPSPEPADKWHEWLPEGSMLVIDEAQRVFRPRANGSKVPPHVEALETHRHQGCDLILVTQHPGLIDVNVRNLVGRHIHIRKTILGLRLYEWSEVGQPGSKASRKDAIDRRYRLNRKVFGMYRSAVQHHKPVHRSSFAPILMALLAVALVFSVVKLYHAFFAKPSAAATAPADGSANLQPSTSPAGTAPRQAQPGAVPGGQGDVVTTQAPIGVRPLDFVPVVPNRPETAPIFDGQRQVKDMEWPDACIASRTKCSCYSGQGTVIKTVDEPTCREIVQNGRHNPYRAAQQYAGPAGPDVKSPGQKPVSGPQIAQLDQSKQAPVYVPFGGDQPTDGKS